VAKEDGSVDAPDSVQVEKSVGEAMGKLGVDEKAGES